MIRLLIGLSVLGLSACDEDVLFQVPPPPEEPPPPPPPAPPPAAPEPPPPPSCERDAVTETFEVFFPARRGCAWSSNPNLGPREGHLQARAIDEVVVNLPNVRALCDLTFRARPGPQIVFDDEVVILLESAVLVAGGSGLALDEYPQRAGFPQFDWEEVKGEPFRARDAPYRCLGGGRCEVPVTEQLGTLDVTIPSGTMIALAQTLDLDAGAHVRFVTLGDNDDSDCAHGDFRMDLEISFVR